MTNTLELDLVEALVRAGHIDGILHADAVEEWLDRLDGATDPEDLGLALVEMIDEHPEAAGLHQLLADPVAAIGDWRPLLRWPARAGCEAWVVELPDARLAIAVGDATCPEAVVGAEHPFTLPPLAAREVGGRPWLLMAIPAGQRLVDILSERGSLDDAEACRVARHLTRSMMTLDRHGCSLRGVSPEDVVVGSDGYLLLTAMACAAAEPGCCAPEVRAGASPTVRSQIYALGELCARMVGDTWGEPADRCAPFLRSLIERATDDNPEWRHGSFAALMAVLMREPSDPQRLARTRRIIRGSRHDASEAAGDVPENGAEGPDRVDGAADRAPGMDDGDPPSTEDHEVPDPTESFEPAHQIEIPEDPDERTVVIADPDAEAEYPRPPPPPGPLDLHCHLLPRIDDGPVDLSAAIGLCRTLKGQGIRRAVATPHWMHPAFPLEWHEIEDAYHDLLAALAADDDPLFVELGAENHWDGRLQVDVFLEHMRPLGGSRAVLIDLPDDHVPLATWDLLFQIQVRGLTPILAHPERNLAMDEAERHLARYCSAGGWIQLSVASLAGRSSAVVTKRAEGLLKRHRETCILASDAHDLNLRPPAWDQLSAEHAALRPATWPAALAGD